MQERVVYTCKKCGWNASIIKEWADLRPQRCMNKKCGVSFRAYKDQLDIKWPEKPQTSEKPKTTKFQKKNNQKSKTKLEAKLEDAKHNDQRSSEDNEQQDYSEESKRYQNKS